MSCTHFLGCQNVLPRLLLFPQKSEKKLLINKQKGGIFYKQNQLYYALKKMTKNLTSLGNTRLGFPSYKVNTDYKVCAFFILIIYHYILFLFCICTATKISMLEDMGGRDDTVQTESGVFAVSLKLLQLLQDYTGARARHTECFSILYNSDCHSLLKKTKKKLKKKFHE